MQRISKPLLALALGVVFGAASLAEADTALAQKNGCTACHAVDTKIVGPSFQEIAEKYRDQENAKVFLSAKVRSGGSGIWGTVPMPPNAHVSDADIATLVDWILQR